MTACVRWISVLGVLFFAMARAWAGDGAVESGPRSAEFDRLFTEWKGVLDQLHGLRDDYRRASPGKKGKLEQGYDELLKQSERMLVGLTAAAEAAFLEAPGAESHPAELLASTMEGDCEKDAHEEAFRLANLLLDHGFDQKDLYGCAGISAFAVNEFGLAEKWLRIAKDHNVLARYRPPWNEIGVAALSVCPSVREAWKKEQPIRAAEAKAEKSPETWLPRVLLKTTKGDIELELFENEAPNTVANFVALVEEGAYKSIPFYSVVPGSGVETGGLVAADGKVRHIVLLECDQPSRAHFRGSVTMAVPADGRGGGTSQFRLLFLPRPDLNGKHTCFGRVVRGMEILSRLQRINPDQFDVAEPDKIVDAKVLRKRNHAYELRKPSASKSPASKP